MSNKLDTLAYTRCPVPTGLGIAIQHGWLQNAVKLHDVSLNSILESPQQAVRESHFNHSVRNSVRHGGNIPAIGARARGADTKVIGLSWADEVQLILTQPNSGIRSVKDLKGRRFGLPNWKAAEVDFARAQAIRALENGLSLEGLSVNDVELVNLDIENSRSDAQATDIGGTLVYKRSSGSRNQNAEVIALLRDEVDAIFLKGTHGARIADDFGLHVVIDTGSHPDPLIRSNNGTPRTVTIDTNIVENHFDLAVTVIDQILKAESWVHQHPDEARRYLARETNASEYWVRAAYGDDAQLRLRTDLAEQSVQSLQNYTNFLHRWKFIPNAFDVHDWIDVRPLDAAQRQSIAI